MGVIIRQHLHIWFGNFRAATLKVFVGPLSNDSGTMEMNPFLAGLTLKPFVIPNVLVEKSEFNR